MKITLLTIGKNKDKAQRAIQAEYVKRLSAFAKVVVVEVKDEANTHTERAAECEKIKDREAARALEKIDDRDFVILLDLHGKQWDSETFAKQMDTWMLRASSIVFVIAGSLGPGKALVERADVRWQLSQLTFTHLMTRTLVLEQIYRTMMILHGRTYHK